MTSMYWLGGGNNNSTAPASAGDAANRRSVPVGETSRFSLGAAGS